MIPIDSETLIVWSDEWDDFRRENPTLAGELESLVESSKLAYTIRPYTFRERLEAETAATRITDDGFIFDQWVLISTLLSAVTGISAETLESLPAAVGMRLWQRVEAVSQFPNLNLWKMRVSVPTASSTAAPKTRPRRPRG